MRGVQGAPRPVAVFASPHLPGKEVLPYPSGTFTPFSFALCFFLSFPLLSAYPAQPRERATLTWVNSNLDEENEARVPAEGKTVSLLPLSPPLMRETAPGRLPLPSEGSSQFFCHCALITPRPRLGTAAGPFNSTERTSSLSFSGPVQQNHATTLPHALGCGGLGLGPVTGLSHAGSSDRLPVVFAVEASIVY